MKVGRIMAVMTPEPLESLPGVPSMKDAGFPGVYASTWYAVFGPANMPPAIVEKLNAAVNAFLRNEDAKKKFETLGLRPLGGSSSQLATKMAEDKIQWAKLIKDADIKMNDQK